MQSESGSAAQLNIKLSSQIVVSVVHRPVQRPGLCHGHQSRPRRLRTACRPMTAGDGKNTVTGHHPPSPADIGRLQLNSYTVTAERAVQDINRFIYISRLSISSKNSDSDRVDV